MKWFFVFLFSFTLPFAYAQDWKLEKVDSTLKFRFEYSLCFQHLDDSSTFELIREVKDDSLSNFTGTVFDNNGQAVALARIQFKNEKGILFQSKTDVTGHFSIQIPAGQYEIACLSMNHDVLRFEAAVLAEEHYLLSFKMGLATEMIHYRINAVNELSATEWDGIMNCIKANGQDSYSACSVLGEYYVTIVQ